MNKNAINIIIACVGVIVWLIGVYYDFDGLRLLGGFLCGFGCMGLFLNWRERIQ